MSDDLTVRDALQRVLKNITVLSKENISLLASLGYILAEDIVAQDSLPPFANSAMDGYAVLAADTQTTPSKLTVIGDIPAGMMPLTTLITGTAMRIMTGAPLPRGADAIVPVEGTNEAWREKERPLPATIEIRQRVQAGDYVRQVGEDIQAGTVVISAGKLIRPQEIGVMASLGVSQVPVIRQPKVGILATGDELVAVEEPLQLGKIRNSNAYTQAAQVRQLGAQPVLLGIAQDTETDVRQKLQAGVDAGIDLFISSAGVSVGAYDVVKSVLETDGEVNFWRVRMRPGKPLAFGTYAGIPYLGLPGNPVSAAVSFERFARPAILKLAGHTQLSRPQVPVIVQDTFNSDGRESYIRAVVQYKDDGYIATTTGGQGSHMMTSLVKANALMIVPEGVTQVDAGTTLQAMMIDWTHNT